MKKSPIFIIGTALSLLIGEPVFATSGACSYHGGVDCSAGADYDGSVICNDGNRDSSVLYTNMESCRSTSSIIPISDCKEYFALMHDLDVEGAAYLKSSYFLTGACYYEYRGYIPQGRHGYDVCPTFADKDTVLNRCQCRENAFLTGGTCTYASDACREMYGTGSIWNIYSKSCDCSDSNESFDSVKGCVAKMQATAKQAAPAQPQINTQGRSDVEPQKQDVATSSQVDSWLENQMAAVNGVDQKLIQSMSGKILLQVEDRGAAWYLDPATKKRYYLKDGQAAYQALRTFGLGITNDDLKRLQAKNAKLMTALKGKILLQVQSKGEAYYIHPSTGAAHYMKDGAEAYRIMRELSLGITNINLNKIPIGATPIK